MLDSSRALRTMLDDPRICKTHEEGKRRRRRERGKGRVEKEGVRKGSYLERAGLLDVFEHQVEFAFAQLTISKSTKETIGEL